MASTERHKRGEKSGREERIYRPDDEKDRRRWHEDELESRENGRDRDSHHQRSHKDEPEREMTRGEKLRAERHAGRSYRQDDDRKERREHREHREDRERRHGDSSRRHRHRSKDRSSERTRDDDRAGERNRRDGRDRRDERDRRDRHSSRHHESRHRDKRRDHDDTQLVVFGKPEPIPSNSKLPSTQSPAQQGQRDQLDDVLRDPKGDKNDALFSVDARGDSQVWQYGTNDARRVPSYHRLAYGRHVLGTSKRFVFDHDGAGNSKATFSIDPGRESLGSVFREKSNAALLQQLYGSSAAKKSKTSASDATPSDGDDEFISLSSKKKRKRGGSGSGSDSQGLDDSSDDDDSESDPDVFEILPDEPENEDNPDLGHIYIVEGDEAREKLKQKLAELSRHVKKNPQDIDAWLELVELQDQQILLLGNDDSTGKSAHGNRSKDTAHSRDQEKGIAAAKLAILESALQQVLSQSDRERLQLAIMHEGAKTWTPQQLASRWADLARDTTLSPTTKTSGLTFSLWKARLAYEMTNLSTVTVDNIKKFISDRLRTLEREALAETDDTRKTELYFEMAYVFLRATRFLYNSGFRDVATAAWQATLESVFARPTPPAASLGQFWDSELPRIGEDGAKGWRDYASKLAAGEDVEEALLDYEVNKQTLPTLNLAEITAQAQGGDEDSYENDMSAHLPLYEAWAGAERQRADLAKLPGRVIDDVDDGGYEDVFRVVVFSDMAQLLFASAIPDSMLSAVQPFIVDAFLLFCQLPPAFGTSTWIETARNDPFLAIVVLPVDDANRNNPLSIGTAQSGRAPPDLLYDGSRIALTPDVLFAAPGWFQYLPDWLRPSPLSGKKAPVPPNWVANTLRQLVLTFDFREIVKYSLAVDAAVNPAGIKKAARSLAKQFGYMNNVYECYALAEASLGNIDVARSVFLSTTKAVHSRPESVDAELEFRQAWAWMELENGQADTAFQRLFNVLPGVTPTEPISTQGPFAALPVDVLRMHEGLRMAMDMDVLERHFGRAAINAQSIVLLKYLSDLPARNIGAALEAAASFSRELESRGHSNSPAHEQFLQSTVARLIYLHARHSNGGLGQPYRPAELLAPVRQMIELFPQNGVFLRLYAWLDPASGFVQLRDPVREIIDEVVTDKKHDCVSGRVFAVRHLLRRSHAQTGYAAARAALDRALSASNQANQTIHSARLWQAYVRLTLQEAVAASQNLRSSGSRKHRRRIDKRMAAVAKDVFYRAVRACPASKEVLLEIFGAPRSEASTVSTPEAAGMSASDLRAVFQTLVSKGLRVHIDLGEVLERV